MIYQSQVFRIFEVWTANCKISDLDKNADEESFSSLFSIHKAKLPLKPTFENGLHGYIEKQVEF